MSTEKTKRGVLIPIGGAEDRGEEVSPRLPFEEKGVLKHVVKEAKGRDSKVVFITTASRMPDELRETYKAGFSRLGCSQFVHHHITEKSQCEDKGIIADFEAADVVMMSGGNQSRIPRAIAKTTIHQLLKDRYEMDRLVIGGTSAGAMAMSKRMIAGGSASEAFFKGAVIMRNGLGLIHKMIIDTHFVRRGRFGRLAEAMARYPGYTGVGLAEDTGVIIRENRTLEIIGSGMVIVMDSRNLTHNNHKILNEGDLLSMTGLTTHFLANGDTYDMEDQRIDVLPIGKEYI